MTQDEIIKLIQGAIARRERPVDALRAVGFVHTWEKGVSGAEQLWELPEVTIHNARLGTKGILSHMFCTLYRHEDGTYRFVAGRVGNTADLVLATEIDASTGN